MAEQQSEYKGHIITWDEDAQPEPLLMIDDIHFHVHKVSDVPGGVPKYHSHACCYFDGNTLLQLGQMLHDTGMFAMYGGGHHT